MGRASQKQLTRERLYLEVRDLGIEHDGSLIRGQKAKFASECTASYFREKIVLPSEAWDIHNGAKKPHVGSDANFLSWSRAQRRALNNFLVAWIGQRAQGLFI